MVKVILGVKGAGKTKTLIDMINEAAKSEPGNVVCIEAKHNMTYSVPSSIRLIGAQEYMLNSYDAYRGFISGLYAGNYDIAQVFIDNLCKTVGKEVNEETESFLQWLNAFGQKNNIRFVVTISADLASVSDEIKAYV